MADDTTLATVDVESGCRGGSKKLRHAQSRSRFCIREATWLMEDTGGKPEGFFFLMATCLYPLSLVPCLVSCRNAGWELSGLVEQRSGLSAWLKTLYTCIFQSV